jgi:hypothetical protein
MIATDLGLDVKLKDDTKQFSQSGAQRLKRAQQSIKQFYCLPLDCFYVLCVFLKTKSLVLQL